MSLHGSVSLLLEAHDGRSHAGIGLAGAVANPMITGLGTADITHILRTAQSRVVFAAEEHRGRRTADVVRSIVSETPSVLEVIAVRGEGPGTLDAILAAPIAGEDDAPCPIDPAGADMVIFTSGTESSPKGVVHSHQTARFDLFAYIKDVLALAGGERVFMPSPISHATGLQWGLRNSLLLRAPLVLQDKWDPKAALDLVDEHRCTFTLAATPFISDLVDARHASGRVDAGRTLRYIASGGAPIPRALVERVRDAFDCPLLSVFGASETFATTANHPEDDATSLATDGRALPDTELAIVDEDGNVLAAGQEGEIVCRGPHVFLGYLGDPTLTQRAFRGDWYRFGDLGVISDHGDLSVTGRIKDIVIRGGQNISVSEVEAALLAHPLVAKVAIVGYPDERLGERCCAFVIPTDAEAPPTLEDLVAFLRDQGKAAYKWPERLRVVDDIPMTPTGKVRKVELRELAKVDR